MQYLLLIYDDENALHNRDEGDMKAFMEAYREYTADIKAKGQMVAGDALQPTTTATSVRVREGKTITTDGYYLVEAQDIDEAISLAARIPTARCGTIEVRPIWVYS